MGSQKLEAGTRVERFSLVGGPLHRLGSRWHLVHGDTNSLPLGLALGWGMWAVLAALALVEGITDQVFSLELIGAHVRLLVVIPLFFLCEAWIAPRMTEFAVMIVRSGVVPETTVPAFDREITHHQRRKDSSVDEAACLAAAVLLSLFATQLHLPGTLPTPTRALIETTLAGHWYGIVCLTIFRFLLFRWVWRLCLWWYFLWRLRGLRLQLIPTHPDGAGGLGYLEVVHTHFIPLVMALSAIESASLAEQIVAGAVAFEAMYPVTAVILLADAAVFLGPLFLFTRSLWGCWTKGLSDYMSLAGHYVRGFDGKWLRAATPPPEPLLGTPDIQSLSDLSNSVDIILKMKRVPASPRLVTEFVLAAVLPLMPLFLLKYPVAELAQRLFARLFGL